MTNVGAGSSLEPLHRACPMHFNRANRDSERTRHLLIGLAEGEQERNLTFTSASRGAGILVNDGCILGVPRRSPFVPLIWLDPALAEYPRPLPRFT